MKDYRPHQSLFLNNIIKMMQQKASKNSYQVETCEQQDGHPGRSLSLQDPKTRNSYKSVNNFTTKMI